MDRRKLNFRYIQDKRQFASKVFVNDKQLQRRVAFYRLSGREITHVNGYSFTRTKSILYSIYSKCSL